MREEKGLFCAERRGKSHISAASFRCGIVWRIFSPDQIAFPSKSRYTFFALESNPTYIIGIDGGGTKTTAQLCRGQENILAEEVGGPSNFQIIGAEAAAITILDLVQGCCRKARIAVSEVGALVAGLSGAGRVSDQERMTLALQTEAVKRRIQFRNFKIESDARIALEGAHAGGPGIIVIAGTGSIVFGKDKLGKVHRAGGWGRIIGDEGGGFTIGKLALRAVARDFDGRGSTRMTQLVASQFPIDSPEAMIRAVYTDALDIAALAAIVIEAAGNRDKVARAILSSQAKELAADVAQVAKKIRRPNKKISIAFVGSIAEHRNYFSTELTKHIRSMVRGAHIVKPATAPVHGAVLMALRALSQSQ